MANGFYLTLKTSKPVFGSFDLEDFYKDNSTPIGINVTNASFMKVWCNTSATGSTDDPEFPENWSPCSATNSWYPSFVTEGTNYIHAIFQDGLNNITDVVDSNGVIYDKTLPSVTAVTINNDADITTSVNAIVKVTASDTLSGVQKTILSGDLAATSQTEFIWTESDRTAGYKNCTVILSANATGVTRSNKTVNAVAVDRAGNTSEQLSDNIVLYTGGVDPVMVMKDGTAVIGSHYGKELFDLSLQVMTGDPSMILGYKIWGDYSTTEGSVTPTPEPTDYTTWGSGSTKLIEDLYLTATDGNKSVLGKVKLSVGTLTGTVDTFADLPETAADGAKYKVTADETKTNKATCYQYNDGWDFYGYLSTDDSYTEKDLDTVMTHHSSSEPIVSLSTNKSILSAVDGFNKATLTVGFNSSCGIAEYKVVAYETHDDAAAGTSADPTNVDLYGTDEKEATSTWSPELLESKLVSAIPDDGAKFIVAYAKNLCGKWGKSSIVTITVDTVAPVGTITVDAFYNTAKGVTASATDSSTVKYMTAWVDASASTSTPPSTAVQVDYHIDPTASEIDWSAVVEGDMYVHIEFEDVVGNKSVAHSVKAVYDTTAPTGCAISTPGITNTTTITASLTATDNLSGVGKVKIFGDIVGSATADWQAYTSSVTIELTSGDGEKTIKALFMDKAGNITETAVQSVTVLDTEAPGATVVFFNADDTAALGNKTGVRNIRVHIGAAVSADLSHIVSYKLWGAGIGTETEPTSWSDYAPDSGKTYKSIPIELTTGDGAKVVKAKIKDDAGNESAATTVTITLDTVAPTITVTAVDYTQVSLSDSPRYTASGGEISGTKSSEMTFKFSSDVKLSEFKVCVYDPSKTAANAEAITETKSINMTGVNIEADTAVSCLISSADYKEHSVIDAQTSADKIGYVIVVGKSESGIYSAYEVVEGIAIPITTTDVVLKVAPKKSKRK